MAQEIKFCKGSCLPYSTATAPTARYEASRGGQHTRAPQQPAGKTSRRAFASRAGNSNERADGSYHTQYLESCPPPKSYLGFSTFTSARTARMIIDSSSSQQIFVLAQEMSHCTASYSSSSLLISVLYSPPKIGISFPVSYIVLNYIQIKTPHLQIRRFCGIRQ